jgi:hypothetical protein
VVFGVEANLPGSSRILRKDDGGAKAVGLGLFMLLNSGRGEWLIDK